MSEIDEVKFDAPPAPTARQKKRAIKKAAGRARAVAKAAKGDPFPGLTKTGCADGCNATGCVISKRPYCAHPTKGGLQTVDMNDAGALKRLRAARDQLGVRVDPERFKD